MNRVVSGFLAIFIAAVLVSFLPAALNAQADNFKNTDVVYLTPSNMVLIFSSKGLTVLDEGKITSSFHRVMIGDTVHVNWKQQVVASGRELFSGNSCILNEEQPYNFSGSAEGFTYSSRGSLKLLCGNTVHVIVTFAYHAAYDGVTGELKVTRDDYKIKEK